MNETVSAVGGMPWYNILAICIGICLIMIVGSIFIPKMIKKAGIKKITKEGIDLTDKEVQSIKDRTQVYVHEIQRKQLSFVQEYIKDIRNNLNTFVENKGYRYSDFNIPYVTELMLDEIVNWIIFNNIEDANDYIILHEEKLFLVYKNAIWSSCRGTVNVPIHYKGKEIPRSDCDIDWGGDYFKSLINKATREIVTNLVKIKIMHNSYAETIR